METRLLHTLNEIKSFIKNAWFHYGGAAFDQEALWELLGSILGPGRRQCVETK